MKIIKSKMQAIMTIIMMIMKMTIRNIVDE